MNRSTLAGMMCILAVGGVATTAAAQDPPDVVKLVTDARAAHDEVRTAQYRAHFELKIEGREHAYTRTGEVWFVKQPPPTPPPPPPPDDGDGDGVIEAIPLIPMTGPRSELGANVRIALDDGNITSFDGATTYVLNPEMKQLITAALADGGENFITGNITGNLVETPLLQSHRLPAPPDGALNYAGEETINGIDCHVLEFRAPDTVMLSSQHDTIWLGKDDLLMRQRDTRYVIGGNTQRERWIISNLVINGEIDDGQFEIALPDGFTIEVYKPEPPPALLGKGENAPEWTLKDATGNEHSLSEYAGNIVVLDFWGTWCGPCLMAMPAIQNVHEAFKDRGVSVIGISCQEREGADPAGFMAEKGFTYGLLLNGESAAAAYRVSGYPTIYIIDRSGKIVDAHVGFSDQLESELTATLDVLVGE